MNDKEKDIIRSYGRRKSKTLSSKRSLALEEIIPLYGIEKDIIKQDKNINPAELFTFKPKEVWFEIGFGSGEHLVHQALNNPEVGLIGCEPFINGVSALCVSIKEHNIKNILIWDDDARLLMDKMNSHSLDKLFLLHPDPWPKTKHHKRRFVQKETLDAFSKLLKDGAEFRTATDHKALAQWMMEKIYFHPNFTWKASCANDWNTPPDDWTATRYCNKGKSKNHIQVYLNFKNKV